MLKAGHYRWSKRLDKIVSNRRGFSQGDRQAKQAPNAPEVCGRDYFCHDGRRGVAADARASMM
jgi:hypothetical protein